MSSRRDFIATCAGAVAVACLPQLPIIGGRNGGRVMAAEPPVKLKKALKYDMISGKVGNALARLELAKKCGFVGVEVNSPSEYNREELVEASKKTDVKIHGVIDSIHWNLRLSDPDPEKRAKGLEGVRTALKDAKTYGADTVLVVPGKVISNPKAPKDDVTYEECSQRSQEELRKVIPLADELGVKIAIEVVWNGFITKPEQLVEYVDAFKTPTIGAYFDASNMVKFGVPSAEWIRKLGKRMLKMDFKGYSKAKGWVPIGEGDEDWPDVLKACAEVGYNTWATAEVGGGAEETLLKISKQMDKILGYA